MKQIAFNKTSNIFINSGIVALHRVITKYLLQKPEFGLIRNELRPDKLIVENDNLLKLLEEVYYFMGKEIYDTASKKQKDQSDKLYFVEDPFSYGKFPKMNSFGLAGFITKPPFGPQPTPRVEPVKFSKLYLEKPVFAKQIARVYKSHKQKLKFFEFTDEGVVANKSQNKGDSAIYLNEPYSKTPRLSLSEKYFERGQYTCPILNEEFKILVSSKGSFAFSSNLENFNSHLENDDNRKVSLKARYLALFAPALAMYSYYNGYDAFTTTFFNSRNLVDLNALYSDEFYYTKDEMSSWDYSFSNNIKLEDFKFEKKDGRELKYNSARDAFSPYETSFLLIYTFYRKKLKLGIESNSTEAKTDPFADSPFDKTPISLVTFKAKTFAATMRPDFYEEFSNVKFIVRLIHAMETNKDKPILLQDLWHGLKLEIPKYGQKKPYDLARAKAEREIRQNVLSKLLKSRSILNEFEALYTKCYSILANGTNCGYRRYDLLTTFLTIYEPAINFGGIPMDKSLQQRAINLGKSIGQGIINFDNPKNDSDKKANAKNGRKYLISMHKARNISQFREVLIRIQRRYSISVANEIIENLDESNYMAIKQYAQIGALNTLNVVLSN